MKAEQFSGRTPDGKYTTSLPRYLREWRKLTKPLKQKLGVTVIGFDPGILIHDPQARTNGVDIPTWLAKRLVAALEQP